MALVTIVLDTTDPADKQALTQLFGSDFVKVADKEPAVTVVRHEAPAAKAKAATPKPKPEPVKEEPAEDLISGGQDLREQAVQKATELVTGGKSATVREALSALGAKRVSDLADDQLEGFLAAVSA
ncbi:MAG TPA: hypothetical protein PLB92_00265 [Rhodoglobus sp.]|nr:hypothetical protein [Rhodoglobus sp.]